MNQSSINNVVNFSQRYADNNGKHFTELEHEYIHTYAEILIGMKLFSSLDSGMSDEGHEWYCFIDETFKTRLTVEKIGSNGKIHVCRNGVHDLIDEPLDVYFTRFWGHLAKSYNEKFQSIETNQVVELPFVKNC